MLYDKCIVYLDDIICWADSLDEMEEILNSVCSIMAGAGLKLNGEKSSFLTRRLEVLGHWVESGLLLPDSEKLQWINLKCTNTGEVRSLLGALSYFRKFVPKFSSIMRPVNDLLTADPVEWKPEHQEAVEKVMKQLE